MGDDHVAKRPGLLIEAGAALDVELLGDVDLDVGDVVAVPDGLEDPVREAQRQDVLRRLLAQEVVDPVDRLLLEHLVQVALSSLALATSWPNGFSTTSEQFSAIPLLPSIRTMSCIALGGTDR